MTTEVWVAFWIGGVVKYLLGVAEEARAGFEEPGFEARPVWQQLISIALVAALWWLIFPVTTVVAYLKKAPANDQ